MSGIVDQVKEAVGLASPDYPAEVFQLSGKDPALHLEQNAQNKPGERPGKQSKMEKVSLRCSFLVFVILADRPLVTTLTLATTNLFHLMTRIINFPFLVHFCTTVLPRRPP